MSEALFFPYSLPADPWVGVVWIAAGVIMAYLLLLALTENGRR